MTVNTINKTDGVCRSQSFQAAAATIDRIGTVGMKLYGICLAVVRENDESISTTCEQGLKIETVQLYE